MPASMDLSRIRRTSAADRQPWHGAAFIVEALVLLAFLMASLGVMASLMGAAHERGAAADRLSHAVILASNEAEAFAAEPDAASSTTRYVFEDGALRQVEGDGADAGGGAAAYEVQRLVERRGQEAGALYEARIMVSCEGQAVYELDTSRYVSNREVAR